MKTQKCLCLTVLFFLMILPTAWAGVYWESVVETRGVPQGMPSNMPKEVLAQFNKTEVTKNYVSTDASRSESRDSVLLMDFASLTICQISPSGRSYTQMDIRTMMGQGDMGKMVEEMKNSIKITPTDETRTVAGYKCRKYLVSMMMGQGEYWVSQEVPGYEQLREIGKKMQEFLEKNPMLRQMNVAGMMEQLNGFPVQTVMETMGMTTVTTLKRIEEKVLDKNLFKVPAGYKKVEMPTMPYAHGTE
ncbi:hypothetical protein DENIS_3919 [Desulfonema ishimotonii]|uniref:DUF4412 domain-containing protein n=1 Tax=Desulfonema ishimotonii TaxID=45657 RepID=A0A401G144_9BACT|nr:DUF4412 domain-containing protein [Desulfonema ishimotonii]GBC62935.1 hypothetical protein DENIS_3919 [Desulfonema ishimotonii]